MELVRIDSNDGTIYFMHMPDDLGVSSYPPPVIICFVEIGRSGDLGTRKSGEWMPWRDVVKCDSESASQPKSDRAQQSLKRKDRV